MRDNQLTLERAENALEQATARRKELEGKIDGYKLMQERKRQKLEFVRGAKEASALMAELDLARSVLANEESDWIHSADDVDRAEQNVLEIKEQVEALVVEQAPRREELAERSSASEKLQNQMVTERDEAKGKVEASLLKRYDRISRNNSRKALYEIHSSACGSCYGSVPMHLRQQVQRGDSVIVCESCGVLLFAKPASQPE